MSKFFNKETIKNTNITFPDIYFTPEYCYACEFSDNAEFEICVYKDLMYVYLKKIFVFVIGESFIKSYKKAITDNTLERKFKNAKIIYHIVSENLDNVDLSNE